EHVERRLGGADLYSAEGAFPIRVNDVERFSCAGRPAKAVDQAMSFVGVASHAQAEDDLSFLAIGEVEGHLQRGARVEARSRASRQTHLPHGRGTAQRAVAADELAAVAGRRMERFADVEERDVRREL